MGVFNSDAEENSFIRNLHLLSFSKEVSDTLNLICGMCEKPFFTNLSGVNFAIYSTNGLTLSITAGSYKPKYGTAKI